MRWGTYVFLFLIASQQLAFGEFADGLCQTEITGSPGLPKATCYFPSCPVGADCMPPTIDRKTAQIEFYEPLIQWKDTCPNTAWSSACWEVHLDFKFRMGAVDPSGVSFIGVHLAHEVDNKKFFKKFWVKAQQKDSTGKFALESGMVVHVPPGQRLELSVFELCAKDGINNEGCVLPEMKHQIDLGSLLATKKRAPR